ncbi:PREDICTED: uncharacterized protein LOC104751667 [Camelina sativa]|uniref:Uncharacterized protein LOC104751667 n=1 Tax=Camelina sativa TaxID=90675 RepID=A0ABM0WJG8_CAMSA|nr:PREDICTED: uncharacterized protein LOC104751667 [Camelina sativa]
MIHRFFPTRIMEAPVGLIVEVQGLVGGKDGLHSTSLRRCKICLANEFVLLSYPLMQNAREIQTLYFSGGGCFDRLVMVLVDRFCLLCATSSDHEELGLLCWRFKEKKQTLWERLNSEFKFQVVECRECEGGILRMHRRLVLFCIMTAVNNQFHELLFPGV